MPIRQGLGLGLGLVLAAPPSCPAEALPIGAVSGASGTQPWGRGSAGCQSAFGLVALGEDPPGMAAGTGGGGPASGAAQKANVTAGTCSPELGGGGCRGPAALRSAPFASEPFLAVSFADPCADRSRRSREGGFEPNPGARGLLLSPHPSTAPHPDPPPPPLAAPELPLTLLPIAAHSLRFPPSPPRHPPPRPLPAIPSAPALSG